MKKLAIFVEGQTEQIFIHKLLIEIVGSQHILIEELKPKISNKGNRFFTTITTTSKVTNEKYYILIYDSGSDSLVKSDILDQYHSLAKSGYDKIIGLRDVRPIPANEINKLISKLHYGVPTKPIPVNIILAIMEIEAWFLAEIKHFRNINCSLTETRIVKHLNFDPRIQDVETRLCPSDDLDSIYRLEGLAYTKKKTNCQRTINALDYSEIYFLLPKKINSLFKLLTEIDNFFFSSGDTSKIPGTRLPIGRQVPN